MILCALLFISFRQARAQQASPILINYSSELVSSEVYDLYQDKKRRIWIASDRGLSVYDSKVFKEINVFEQLNSYSVYGFEEVNSTEVWINNENNELFYFNPLADTITFIPYEYNTPLKESIAKSDYSLKVNLVKISENGVSVSFMQPGKISIDTEGNLSLEDFEYKEGTDLKFVNILVNTSPEHPFTSINKKPHTNGQLLALNNESMQILSAEFNHKVAAKMNSVSSFEKLDSFQVFAVGRYLIKKPIDSKFEVLTLQAEILDLEISGNQIIVGTFQGVYEVSKSFQVSQHYLAEQAISSVLIDADGGCWFSSLGKGLFYTSNIDIKVLNESENLIPQSLTYFNDLLICNDNNLKTLFFSSESFVEMKGITQLGEIFRSQSQHLTPYLGLAHYEDSAKLYGYVPNLEQNRINAYGKYIRVLHNNLVKSYRTDSVATILCSAMDSESTALIGTKDGVYEFSEEFNLKKKLFPAYPNNAMVRSIICLDSKTAYLMNNEVFIDNEECSIVLSVDNELVNEMIVGIEKAGENALWIFGPSAIEHLDLSSNQPIITHFQQFDFLPTTKVSAICQNDRQLFVGTTEGIYSLPNSALKSEAVLKKDAFYIDSIKYGDKIIQNSDTISISSNNEGLTFYYNYISYNQHEIEITYQLNEDGIWRAANSKHIYLSSLANGSHLLQIRAKFKDEELILGSFIIIVPTPIFETIWFIPLNMFILFALLFIVFRKVLLRRQEKEKEKIKLEMSLLASRMNPHFTFNTISSIQSYILKNDKAPAIEYLSEFGTLMRKSLDFSYKDSINFSDEIAFIELSLKLENKRFEDDFKLKLLRKDSKRDFAIPAMLLQPLVENVVVHAKFLEDDEKAIHITVEENEVHKTITVEDFGLTQEGAENKSAHKSVGLSIIKDRIRLHNGKFYKEPDFIVEQKLEAGESGYKITIKLSKK